MLIKVLCCALIVSFGAADQDEDDREVLRENRVEVMAERQQQWLHTVDTLNLLLYTGLLGITMVTIYIFRRRQIRIFHESGMIMIYGLIVGLAVKLAETNVHHKKFDVGLYRNSSELRAPPVILRLAMPKPDNSNAYFTYRFVGGEQNQDNEFEQTATFDPEIFFNVLLPPILFHAGYCLKRKHFFRNIGSIMSFAFLGTTISCVVVGGLMYGISQAATGPAFDITQCLYFGALISATDPVTTLSIFSELQVDVDLYALVFGESALNDAVALVLSSTVEPFLSTIQGEAKQFTVKVLFQSMGQFFGVFFGSFGLGALVGCLCALVMKFTSIRDTPIVETALFILMSYMSFLVAEACHMTGIVAVLFCGICQAHYTFNNLSIESQVRTKQFFEILNLLSESFIFTYIGVSMFTSQAHIFEPAFIVGSFFAILLGRAIFVYPLCALMNCKRKPPIPMNHQHMLLFSGLRGAVAFALAIRNTASPQRQIIYTTTSLIVICTVIFNGSLTSHMLSWLKIRTGAENETELTPQLERPEPIVDDQTGTVNHQYNPWDKSFLPRKWYNFDSQFMKPLLTHSRPNLMETMPHCCLPLSRLLTSTQQMSARDFRAMSNSEADLTVADTGQLGPADQADIFAPPETRAGAYGVQRSRSLEDMQKLNVYLPGMNGRRL